MKHIAIFKTGQHTATSGDTLTATAAMLEQVVSTYHPSAHEAPAVIGHPKDNHPAYGWVSGLSFDAQTGTLYADFSQIEPQFATMLKAGRFKKRSASFYPPDHPQNPTKGKWYLRHVGFLGAQPPAVKGLKDFSDGAQCPSYEFSAQSNLLTTTHEEPMKIKPNPNYSDQTVNQSQSSHAPDSPAPTLLPSGQTADFSEREAAIKQAEAAIAQREATLKASEAAFMAKKAEQTKKHYAEFCDTLIASGKALPVEKDAVVSALCEIANSDSTFDFAENGTVENLQAVANRGLGNAQRFGSCGHGFGLV